jgi:hypothetical protein
MFRCSSWEQRLDVDNAGDVPEVPDFFFYFFLLHGLSPRANYTDRATAACRQSDCQLLRIKGATWSA